MSKYLSPNLYANLDTLDRRVEDIEKRLSDLELVINLYLDNTSVTEYRNKPPKHRASIQDACDAIEKRYNTILDSE